MKSTWKKSASSRRSNMKFGFAFFVAGIAIASYCGYMERYAGDPQSEGLKLFGWGLLSVGFVLLLLGILQSPIRRD